jgi:hypothetical protein
MDGARVALMAALHLCVRDEHLSMRNPAQQALFVLHALFGL